MIKGKGGAIGLFQHEGALLWWLVAQPMLALVCAEFEKDLSWESEDTEGLHHEEGRSFQESFSEKFKCLVQVFEDKVNSFDDNSGTLYSLCTRNIADETGISQLKNLKSRTLLLYRTFVESVILQKSTSFWEPIKRIDVGIFWALQRTV